MLLRALCCATLLLVLSAQSSAPATFEQYPQVHQVKCLTGRGSAVLTEAGWISASHVTSDAGCFIDGQSTTDHPEKDLDFSRVEVALKGRGLKINCEGFKTGTWVWAVGFAHGYEWQTMTRHLVTFKSNGEGLRMLLGSPTVIPGMSGGAILNEAGEVVGIVNAYNTVFPISLSRELKDTSLCRHS